jgi:histidinol-phosphate/aromatic aminotransferase/cobyric acid decarboxylase-like protein
MRRYVRQIVDESKPIVTGFCERRGIPVWPGAANFALIRLPDRDKAVEFLRDRGILVHTMNGPLLRDMVRVGMGTPAEMTRFTSVLEEYLPGNVG